MIGLRRLRQNLAGIKSDLSVDFELQRIFEVFVR